MTALLRAQSLAAMPARALLRLWHRLYTHALIASAESDLRHMQDQIDHAARLPAQMAIHRSYIAGLRVRLIVGG